MHHHPVNKVAVLNDLAVSMISTEDVNNWHLHVKMSRVTFFLRQWIYAVALSLQRNY